MSKYTSSFHGLITSLLKRGNINNGYLSVMTDDRSMEEYVSAFTSSTVDPVHNYEVYEQMGDVTINKFIVMYMYKRFPQLIKPRGVKVVARLKINYGSQQMLSHIGRTLGFWEHIRADNETKENKSNALIEDCMESFFGCTEYLLDNKTQVGVGFSVAYDILKSIFDEIPISLRYEDLYDAKTRLKELFDYKKSELGTPVYIDRRNDQLKAISEVYSAPPNTPSRPIRVGTELVPHQSWFLLGSGCAKLKGEAQQLAAQKAIENLRLYRRIEKPVPQEYLDLQK